MIVKPQGVTFDAFSCVTVVFYAKANCNIASDTTLCDICCLWHNQWHQNRWQMRLMVRGCLWDVTVLMSRWRQEGNKKLTMAEWSRGQSVEAFERSPLSWIVWTVISIWNVHWSGLDAETRENYTKSSLFFDLPISSSLWSGPGLAGIYHGGHWMEDRPAQNGHLWNDFRRGSSCHTLRGLEYATYPSMIVTSRSG